MVTDQVLGTRRIQFLLPEYCKLQGSMKKPRRNSSIGSIVYQDRQREATISCDKNQVFTVSFYTSFITVIITLNNMLIFNQIFMVLKTRVLISTMNKILQ